MLDKCNKYAYILVFAAISLVLSALILALHSFGILSSGMSIIQHVLTISSIVLGVVTLVLTIMISIRDGDLYQRVKKERPQILEQIYGFSCTSMIASGLSIMISICILLTAPHIEKNAVYRALCVFSISFFFFYMVLSVIMAFWQSIQMLNIDDSEK